MSLANLVDISLIEVNFDQSTGRREKSIIRLQSLLSRGDAMMIAKEIRKNKDVTDVRCFTTKGSFI